MPDTYNFDGSAATEEQASQPVNGCYLTQQACIGDTCNLKLFVAWTGTDVDGNVLLSANSRFSLFPPNRIQEQIQSRYDSLKDKITDAKDFFTGD